MSDTTTEYHQAPAGVPKADTVLLGTGIEVDGHVFTEAKIKFVGGMSEFAIPDPPRRGSLRTYVVKAVCTRYLIDEKGEEPRLILEMQHFVVYDRDQGPLNDRQRVETPAELEELDRKAKDGVEEPDVDENQPGLFGDAPDDRGDEPEAIGSIVDGLVGDELPEGPEWGDAEASAQQPKDDSDAGRPAFSSIDGGQS